MFALIKLDSISEQACIKEPISSQALTLTKPSLFLEPIKLFTQYLIEDGSWAFVKTKGKTNR